MATYGGGTRVNAAVSASATASNAGGNTYATVYTCPANCYAVLWVRGDFSKGAVGSLFSYGTAHYIYVGGQYLAVVSTSSNQGGYGGIITSGNTTAAGANNSNTAICVFQIYVGPGQTVQARVDHNGSQGTATTTVTVQGTEFINA